AGERRRAADGHLLPEHGAHRELEGVPRARDAEPRSRADGRREARLAREPARDRRGRCVEVEEPADARRERRDVGAARDPERGAEPRRPALGTNAQRAGDVTDANRPPVDARFDGLDAGNRTRREEGEQPIPRERRLVGEPDDALLEAGRQRRPAAQAGAEAGGLRGGGRGEEADVVEVRRPRGTHGPAEYAGRRDADEDPAVEPGIAADERPIATTVERDAHRATV